MTCGEEGSSALCDEARRASPPAEEVAPMR